MGGNNECFFNHNIVEGGVGERRDEPLLGRVEGRRDEPKADQKIVIRGRVQSNRLFNTVQSSFVPHCSLPSSPYCLVK